MPTFATDTDLLHWEPNVFTDAQSVSQILLLGTGELSGTTFTIDSGSLIDSHIAADEVIALGAPISGSFPIVSVDNATELTLSVLYDELFPDQGPGEASSPGEGSGLNFSIRTFWPQRRAVSEQLLQAAGVSIEDASKIVNPQSLRRPCVLGTLQMIYSALASSAAEPASLLARAELYERLYRRALRSAMVEIDSDSDGVANQKRSLGVVNLRRA